MISAFFVLVLTAVYLYLHYIFSYWSRYGFPYLKPVIPVGNLSRVLKCEQGFNENIFELHKQTTEPFVGIYMLFKPTILLREAALIRRILIADFAYFHDRGVYCNPKHDPLSENIFGMSGNRWKTLRTKLTPIFTPGKLEAMLPMIISEGDRLINHMENSGDCLKVMDTKDLTSRFTLNVIGSVIFGLDVDTITNPEDKFRTIEKRMFGPGYLNLIRNAALFLCPKLLEFFNVTIMEKDITEYMLEIVRHQIEYRERNNVSRKDFIQTLIQLRNDSKINEDNQSWDVQTKELKSMSVEQCAAQVFMFYIAGSDTTATTLSFLLYELARNIEVQRRLQLDIDTILDKHNGELTIASISEMNYVDICVMETLRKYPPLAILNRECTIDYPIPGTNHVIKKGTAVIVSLLGLSRDPVNFPDPETFRPERFSNEVPTYNTEAYIPFGDGPRACIGLRLGNLSVKIGLIKLLQKFNFELLDHSPIKFDKLSITLQAEGGIKLRVHHR